MPARSATPSKTRAATRWLIAPLLLAMLGVAAPAQAAVETWNQFQTTITIDGDRGVLPHSLGFVTDVRFNSEIQGLERVQLRWGPRWDLWGPFSLALNHTAYLQQPETGTFIQEQRAELEPHISGAWGPLSWRDRSRLELRWRPEQVRWRYRNQLRLEGTLAPGWQPFVADEVFVDPHGQGLNENRITVGLARELTGGGWELAYTFRARVGGAADATPDHLITLAWFHALRRSPWLADENASPIAAVARQETI